MRRKWKGRLTQDLTSAGAAIKNMEPEHNKGDMVICWKRRDLVFDGKSYFTKGFEYHYTDLHGKNLVRSKKFLIENENNNESNP
jgi:hypothetical protein